MRHRGMRAPINSIKHYVYQSIVEIVNGAILNIVIADAGVAPAAAASNDVLQGSVIKAIWCELWFVGNEISGNLTSFNLTIEKIPSGLTPMTFVQSTNLGSYPNKKNILYTTQGNIGSSIDGVNAVPLVRQFFLIPKGKQRMGLADQLMLNINSVGSNASVCGIFTYKEYR